MDAAGIKLVATPDLVTDEELPNMGDAPLGIVTAGALTPPPHAAAEPGLPRRLAAAATATRRSPITCRSAGWDGMAAIFDVIKRTGGKFDGDQAMAMLSHWKNPDSPRGPIMIDPETRDIVQNIYIRRVERVDGRLANVEFATIPRSRTRGRNSIPGHERRRSHPRRRRRAGRLGRRGQSGAPRRSRHGPRGRPGSARSRAPRRFTRPRSTCWPISTS